MNWRKINSNAWMVENQGVVVCKNDGKWWVTVMIDVDLENKKPLKQVAEARRFIRLVRAMRQEGPF